jgi:predicted kinase
MLMRYPLRRAIGTVLDAYPILSIMIHGRGRTLETNVSRILQSIGETQSHRDTGATLILTVGLPASGKSTFARWVATETGAVVLESDALRRLLFGRPRHTGAESRRLFDAVHAATRGLLEQGNDVIVDATNLRRTHREPFYGVARETHAKLLVLAFSAPESVIRHRLTRRRHGGDPADRSDAGYAVYQMLAEQAEPLDEDHWQIDTSDPAATEAAFCRVVEACRPRLRAGPACP